MKKFFLFILLMIPFCIKVTEIDLSSNSKSAILIESSTGKILYEKNKDEKRSPASMTKIMTLLLTMEALESNKIKLSDEVFISKNASSMGGTQIFAQENTKLTVETLIKGIAIASANDAAVAIAEHIGGTEENFVSMMNQRARDLGCKNTNFKNPHGLDENDHYSTAYDMSLIAKELVKYPLALKITSMYEDYIDVSGENHWLVNTNKLLRYYKGIDGLKTGYTSNALYCLTATMQRNDMRLISVVMGAITKDGRTNDTIKMMEYGYSMYGSKKIYDKNNSMGEIFINNSYERKIKYYLSNDVNIIVNKDTRDINYDIEKKIYDVKAPLKKNDKIGTLKIKYGKEIYEYDLIVNKNIEKNNFFGTMFNNLKDVIEGKIIQ